MRSLAILIVLFLIGCAGVDQHQFELDKAESEYRRSLGKTNDIDSKYRMSGPMEMPQEWLNQWPSLRDPNYVEPVKEETLVITDPCKQLGPAYCFENQ